MTEPRNLAPNRPLTKCPAWPTMQWLPTELTERLSRLLEELGANGFTSSRAELISALVLDCGHDGPALAELLRDYRLRFSPAATGRPRHGDSAPLMLKLRSPISLRVDCLVEQLREAGWGAYRHEVIGALIASWESGPDELERACRSYRVARARDAAVKGQPMARVLSCVTRRPGVRPVRIS